AEDAAALATLLSIDRVAARPGELAALPVDAIAPAARYRYVVSLKQDRLKDWVTAVAAKRDRPALSARFTVNAGGGGAVVPSTTGATRTSSAVASVRSRRRCSTRSRSWATRSASVTRTVISSTVIRSDSTPRSSDPVWTSNGRTTPRRRSSYGRGMTSTG